MSSTTKTWHLEFAQDCNLRCDYCSTLFGTYGGHRTCLSGDRWERLLALMAERLPPNRAVSLELGGGETLLFYDRFLSFLDAANAWASLQGARISVSVLTNGTTLTEARIDELKGRGVRLNFSIDGGAALHDRHRHGADGAGSHAAALRNWLYYTRDLSTEARSSSVASVYTDDTDLAALTEYWAALGVPVFKCTVQLHAVRYSDRDVAEWRQRQARYLEQLTGLARQQAAAGVAGFLSHYAGPRDLYSFFTSLLTGGSCAFCGAGRDTLSVSGDGEIFPCTAYNGSKRYRLGDLDRGFEQEALHRYLAETAEAAQQCAGCPDAEFCPKACFGQYQELSARENVADGCIFGRQIAHVVKDGWKTMLGAAPDC